MIIFEIIIIINNNQEIKEKAETHKVKIKNKLS
jgi:hypothetical protein